MFFFKWYEYSIFDLCHEKCLHPRYHGPGVVLPHPGFVPTNTAVLHTCGALVSNNKGKAVDIYPLHMTLIHRPIIRTQAGIITQSARWTGLLLIRCEKKRRMRITVHNITNTITQAMTLSPRSAYRPPSSEDMSTSLAGIFAFVFENNQKTKPLGYWSKVFKVPETNGASLSSQNRRLCKIPVIQERVTKI